MLIASPSPQQNQLAQQFAQYLEAWIHPDPLLITYLLSHQGRTRYLVGTTTAPESVPFILATGKPVMTLGGYNGYDQILTQDQVSALIQKGTIRYFLIFTKSNYNALPAELQMYINEAMTQAELIDLPSQSEIVSWVTESCNEVQPTQWRPGYVYPENNIDANSLLTLFDCQKASS